MASFSSRQRTGSIGNFFVKSTVLVMLLLLVSSRVNSFGMPVRSSTTMSIPHLCQFTLSSSREYATAMSMNRRGEGEGEDLDKRIDEFLDSPVFDPYDKANESNWFAQLVKSDYATAEALYAGGFFALMVFISQELFRMWLYGENYIPFKSGGASSGVWYE